MSKGKRVIIIKASTQKEVRDVTCKVEKIAERFEEVTVEIRSIRKRRRSSSLLSDDLT